MHLFDIKALVIQTIFLSLKNRKTEKGQDIPQHIKKGIFQTQLFLFENKMSLYSINTNI